MSSTTWRAVSVVLLWLLCAGVAVVSWRFAIGGVDATMGFVAYHAQLRPLAFFGHVILAPVALALVPFQLWKSLRTRRPIAHRMLGRAYVLSVLLSGAGGLWLALTTTAGAMASLGFALLALAWMSTTTWGALAAMQGRRSEHARWMTRSIALTLSAVTLRLYLGLVAALGLPFAEAYIAIAWLCWVPNLLIAEWLISRRQRPAPAA